MKPVDPPRKRLCQPASGVSQTPTTARLPALHVLGRRRVSQRRETEQQIADKAENRRKPDNPADQTRSRTGSNRHPQWSVHGGSDSGHQGSTWRPPTKRRQPARKKRPRGMRQKGEERLHTALKRRRPRTFTATAHAAKPESVRTTVRRVEPQGETRGSYTSSTAAMGEAMLLATGCWLIRPATRKSTTRRRLQDATNGGTIRYRR